MNDFRCAVRSLGRTPGFTIAAALTLALGIGAASAGFTLLSGILLRPLPGVRDASRLGLVWTTAPGGWVVSVTERQTRAIAKRAPAVRDLIGRQRTSLEVGPPGNVPTRVSAEFVMPGYFNTLGTETERGRALGPADDARPGGRPVAVISDHLWRKMLGARPDVIGSALDINGVRFTVAGVAEQGFRGTERVEPVDAWLPFNTYMSVEHFAGQHMYAYEFLMRVRRGASFDLAKRQLSSAIHAVASSEAGQVGTATQDDLEATTRVTIYPGVGLPARGRSQIAYPLHLIMGIAGLVLLVACANVSNLLLFRRAQRRSDSVVRLVLGASRGRLVRYYLIESAVLGVLGGMGGLLLLPWLRSVLSGMPLVVGSLGTVRADWRVFAFAAAIGLAAALLAGLIPALVAVHTDYSSDLKDAGPTQSGGGSRVRSTLTAVQIAVSLTLVSGAYLFARTLQNYARVPLGFDPDSVSVFYVRPKEMGYTAERTRAYLQALADRANGAPGIERVALAQLSPFSRISMGDRIRAADAPSGEQPVSVDMNHVTAGYFDALRISMLRGRTFEVRGIARDTGLAVGQVVLSESLARKLFGAKDPVGALVRFGTAQRPGKPCSVVGVVRDARWENLDAAPPLMAYAPLGQSEYAAPFPLDEAMLLVRSGLPPSAAAKMVQDAARELDPSLPVLSRGPLTGAITASLGDRTFFFHVVGALAALTILLTAVGVYSLVAYAVTSRTREFGIRIAIGASGGDLLRTVARPSLVIIVVGVAAGIGGAFIATRFIKSMLFGVSPFDVAAFVTAAAVLAVVVLIATYLPARRATKIDPVEALRSE